MKSQSGKDTPKTPSEDDVLRRMLNAPPKPHQASAKKSKTKKPAK
jgi:hypothetical protein